MEAKAIKPAFGVLDSLKHIPPSEAFVKRGVAISGEASMNELALSWRYKACGIRIVLDEPVCSNGDDYGCNSLLLQSIYGKGAAWGEPYQDEDPSPAILPYHTSHMTNSLRFVSFYLTTRARALT